MSVGTPKQKYSRDWGARDLRDIDPSTLTVGQRIDLSTANSLAAVVGLLDEVRDAIEGVSVEIRRRRA